KRTAVSVTVLLMASSPTGQLGEAEILDWLENYRQALESKNFDKLVELGLYVPQEAKDAQGVLFQYKDFHVALQNVGIRIGAGSAEVTFTRQDTVEGTLMPPFVQTFIIEKESGGQITLAERG